ncbi:MAG: DUF5615 family PIN-like protein [Candidatus Odinarchaeota archaeon]
MKFKLDENVPWILKKVIENIGPHVVDSIFHENISGIDDKNLNLKCYEEKRILITLNSDFINPIDNYYGIIILRSKEQGKNVVKGMFEKFLKSYSIEESIGKIIIKPNQIRIRSEIQK